MAAEVSWAGSQMARGNRDAAAPCCTKVGDNLVTNLVTFVFFMYFSFPVIPGLRVATVTFDFDHFNFVDL